jgi:hypothetical protein
MKQKNLILHETTEELAQILVRVLLRRFTEDRAETGDKRTCSLSERMAPQQHHKNGEDHGNK